MRQLPLNVQTLYADLSQTLVDEDRPGSVYIQTQRGIKYLYARRTVGAKRVDKIIGRLDDPEAVAKAQRIKLAMVRAKARITTVEMLQRAGLSPLPPSMGRILDALSEAGWFSEERAVLVGTLAYQLSAPLVGALLDGAYAMTQDIDLAIRLSLRRESEAPSLLAALERGDPELEPERRLDGGKPARFRSGRSNLMVDLLAPQLREDEGVAEFPTLGVGAQTLPFMDFLVKDPVRAIALYGGGIPVMVPHPARLAVHKLIIAQRRPDRAKASKDLHQARELITALGQSDPYGYEHALNEAKKRGPKWRSALAASFKQMGIKGEGRMP
jgi:hypothetical protein